MGGVKFIEGLVVRTQSGFCLVDTHLGLFTCQLRGRLKKGTRSGDILAIGDRVEVTPLNDEVGVIEAILPRSRMLTRLSPNPREAYRQIIIANPDLAVLVFACANPAPRLGMLDRFLAIAEKHIIPALILVNKVDLIGKHAAVDIFKHYQPLGYSVHYTSAKSGQGIAALRKLLEGKISVFTGPSGAGKSSLLNHLLPGLELAASAVSAMTGKGTHTTVFKEMYPLPTGGYIADTPGLKALALWDIDPEEIDGYFPEMRDLVVNCHFNDCTHMHEPGCAVIQAVQEGRIHPRRYQSYLGMRLGEEE